MSLWSEHFQEVKETALAGILTGLVSRFVEDCPLWAWAVRCVSELDALMSLAAHALSGPCMARPTLLRYDYTRATLGSDPSEPRGGGGESRAAAGYAAPVLRAAGMLHPLGLAGRGGGAFVPNDLVLGGGEAPPFVVLTGPNMGGKSTLLRQACLMALMAQVGCGGTGG